MTLCRWSQASSLILHFCFMGETPPLLCLSVSMCRRLRGGSLADLIIPYMLFACDGTIEPIIINLACSETKECYIRSKLHAEMWLLEMNFMVE